MNIRSFYSLIFFLLSVFTFGQTEREYRKALSNAESSFESKDYYKALEYLLQIKDAEHEIYISDAEFNFMMASCYWNIDSIKVRAIPYLENYLERTHEEIIAKWWLAELYKMTNKYDLAIANYQVYIEYLISENGLSVEQKEKEILNTERLISSCQYAKSVISRPAKLEVVNLGDSINTPYAEYAPVIDNFEKIIYLTRKSPDNVSSKKDDDGNYYEEIFFSKIKHLYQDKNGNYSEKELDGNKLILQFTKPRNIGKPVNHASHDAAVQLSHNDEHLFILRNNHVYRSVKIEDTYTEPVLFAGLESIVSKGSFIPSLSINKTEDLIYFSSDGLGGFGGFDLYYTKKINNQWQEPVNLGPNINTEFNEDSPYLDPDGHTLYFSSNGHPTIGGYDIFKSYLTDNGFTNPQNLGFPINSSSDDIFFTMPERENRAYFSSNRFGGKGLMDIYEVNFFENRDQLVEVKGKILVGPNSKPGNAKFTLVNNDTDERILNYKSDSLTGNYHVLMHHNNRYDVRVDVKGFAPTIQRFEVPEKLDKYVYKNQLSQKHIQANQINIGHELKYSVPVKVSGNDTIDVYKTIKKAVYFYFNKDSILSLLSKEFSLIETITPDTKFFFPKAKPNLPFDLRIIRKLSPNELSKVEFETVEGVENKAELLNQIELIKKQNIPVDRAGEKPKPDKPKKPTVGKKLVTKI